MDIIYERGDATAQEVLAALPDSPSYSSVRTLLRILEEKGHLVHSNDGPRYVYSPTMPREKARMGALQHVLKTFFGGSVSSAVAALMDTDDTEVSHAELNRLSNLIDRAKQEE